MQGKLSWRGVLVENFSKEQKGSSSTLFNFVEEWRENWGLRVWPKSWFAIWNIPDQTRVMGGVKTWNKFRFKSSTGIELWLKTQHDCQTRSSVRPSSLCAWHQKPSCPESTNPKPTANGDKYCSRIEFQSYHRKNSQQHKNSYVQKEWGFQD